MRQKKGQANAGGAAGLIALIMLFIILYILFLPPGDRADLLGESGSSSGGRSSGTRGTLLSENIGRVDFLRSDNIDKILPNVFLQEKRDATVLKKFNPLFVKNGLFDKKDKEISFSLNDVERLENVQLSFTAKKRKGILAVDLNGERIFESEITEFNIDPITIEPKQLRGDNTLVFSVNGVGARFWKTNEYNLEDIKLIGNIVDKSNLESQSVFTLTGTEFFNLEQAELRFIPYCGNQDVGRLEVAVNNRNVYSSVPVCDDVYNIPLSSTILNAGTNRISFSTESGTYSIEQIRLLGDLKDSRSITRFFEVNNTRNNRDVELVITFTDDRSNKDAEINVNGHLSRLDTRDRIYTKNIDNWLEEGNNYITITPLSTLQIVTLEIRTS